MTDTKPNTTTWFFGLQIADKAITATGRKNIQKLYKSIAIGVGAFAASAIIFFGKKAIRGAAIAFAFLAATHAVKWITKQAARMASSVIMPRIVTARNEFIKDFLMSD